MSPDDANVVVEHLRLADGRPLPLRTGSDRRLEALPASFEATNAAWSIRDVGELLGDAGSSERDAEAAAYLGVIREPATREDLPEDLLERLRALGYVGGTSGVP